MTVLGVLLTVTVTLSPRSPCWVNRPRVY